MNTITHWLIKIVLIVVIFFIAATWKASTRDSSGATSPWPGAVAGVVVLSLLVMKPKKKASTDMTIKPLDKKDDNGGV